MPAVRTDETNIIKKTPYGVIKRPMVFHDDDFATGEVISSVDGAVEVVPSGLTIDSTSVSGRTVQVTMSGGSEGITYKVIVKVITSFAQKMKGAGKLYVDEA